MVAAHNGQQDTLELSVVAHDLRLDNSVGQDLIESVNRYAVRTTPVKFTPPQTARRTSAPRNKVGLDDPDDLLLLTRAEELRQKRYWILPVIQLALYIGTCISPFTKLGRAHLDSRSLLAPTYYFYYYLIPVFSAEAVYVIAALTPVLRGTSIVHKGVSAGYAVSQAFSIVWFWTFAMDSGSPSTALSTSFISWVCALATLLSVKAERRDAMARLWQFRNKVRLNVRDFWLVEGPLTVHLMWTTAALVITGNFHSVYDWLKYHPDGIYSPELTKVMIASAVVSLVFISVFVTGFFCYTKKGSPIAAGMACWMLVDFASNFSASPDVLSSPQLAWIDAKTVGAAFHTGSALLGVFFGIASLLSLSMHCVKFLSKAHTLHEETKNGFSFVTRSLPNYPIDPSTASLSDHWERKSNGKGSDPMTAGVKRRPSEFLIRSLSSLTESNTPICKK
eukprot:Blabericola_migrator_1__12991@NODE_865_length_6229_cov_246_540571_g613_i0_p3_GENE_NODE_865_length_6229_cov_246_540571_g613_i0NODE_865_length_6229_cov_246_540571_g613_i0_p3_ORF_typecomplete_len449_score61_22MgtE/PF01769_16/8_3e02MgtE/PF01769_16/0_02MgtE/PF01769_16/3_7e03_NODE_865_length_6229_cov_246_540571_g613_i07952141